MTATATAPAATPIFHPNLPLSLIIESEHNPRKRFDEDSLKELAATIRTSGIHNPVIVREVETAAGTRFELAAGHRRCRAARMVGLVEVPALIRELDDNAFLELLHLDNLQRDDVDPLDEALGYEQLLARGYDVATIADKIGKSVTYVASRVRLLSLGTAAREAMRLGYVKVSHAIELAKLPEGVQEELLENYWNLSPEDLVRAATGTGSEETQETAEEPADVEVDENEDDTVVSDHFPPPPADLAFRVVPWQEVVEPTLQDLKRYIAEDVYRRLSVVKWDLADATLVPEAGACSTCLKRSSMEPLLFAELDTGEDACLDASCFRAKNDAFTQLQRGIPPEKSHASAATHDDAESRRAEATRQAKQEQQKREAEREKETQALALAQQGRTAAVRAVLAAVPKNALSRVAWLQLLFASLVDLLGATALDQMLVLTNLDTTPPEKTLSYDHSWKRERLKVWAREPTRGATPLTRAIILAALGTDTVASIEEDEELDKLRQFAALVEVDVDAVAAEAMQTAKAETKQARRRKAKAVPA